jgi:hypothetical protein
MHTQVLAVPATGAAAGALLLIAVIGGLVAATAAYETAKRHAFRPRLVHTSLSDADLRAIFRDTVSGRGWSIIDDGNPMVAQSSVLTGVRQQIALHIDSTRDTDERGSEAHIAVVRYSRKALRGTTKAHTLRWRMNAFLTAVRSADLSASIAG